MLQTHRESETVDKYHRCRAAHLPESIAPVSNSLLSFLSPRPKVMGGYVFAGVVMQEDII